MNEFLFLQNANKNVLLKIFYEQFDNDNDIPNGFQHSVEEIMKNVFYCGDIIFNRNPNDASIIDKLNKKVIKVGMERIREYKMLNEKIKECQAIRAHVVEVYDKCNDKEHFHSLLKEYFGVNELKEFIENGELVEHDEYYVIVKEYLETLVVVAEPLAVCVPLDDIFIHLDTRNRNLQQFPRSTHFRFDFVALDDALKLRGLVSDQSKLTGISRIAIENISLNSHWKADLNKFFYISVSELKGFTYPTAINGHNVFGTIIKQSNINDYYDLQSCRRNYATPISLSSLTIQTYDYNLVPLNFGPDGIVITGLIPNGSGTQIVLECDSEVSVGDRIYLIEDPAKNSSGACIYSNLGYIITAVVDSKNLVIDEDVVTADYTGRLLVDKYQWASLWRISFY